MRVKAVVRWTIVVMFIIYAVVMIFLCLDWLSKHAEYTAQRDKMYTLMAAGDNYEYIKGVTGYLQGTSTRALNKLKDSAQSFAWVLLILSLSYIPFYFLMERVKKIDVTFVKKGDPDTTGSDDNVGNIQ